VLPKTPFFGQLALNPKLADATCLLHTQRVGGSPNIAKVIFIIHRISFDGHMRLLSNQLKKVQNFVKNCLYICNAGAIKIDQKNYYMYLS